AHGEVAVPALKARCVDATGAGDAFIAGSLAVLLAAKARPGRVAWRDPELFAEALGVGHMLGAKAVSRAGAVSGLVSLGSAKARIDRARRRFS
ncbi:MAG TPA: PfkB family carbohydrate kinase, partial [Polyangiaceae bacterium]